MAIMGLAGPFGGIPAASQLNRPIPKREVQLGRRTGRPRGAPHGNTNRLTHGRYSAAAKAARRQRQADWQQVMLLSAWTDVVVRMQKLEDLGAPPPPPAKV